MRYQLKKQRGSYLAIIGLLAISVGLTSCSTVDKADVDSLKTQVAALTTKVQELEAKIAELQKTGGSSTQATSTQPTTETNQTSAPSTNVAAKFTDIAGVFGEKEIKDLAAKGVFDIQAPTFEPTKPIKRAEFITWLVKANNAIRPADKQIRLPDADEKPAFPDIDPSNPNFKYVQAMSNAGWSVGFTDKTFKPDKVLTREEMIAIKRPLDEGFGGSNDDYVKKWTDSDKISKEFQHPMSMEAFSDKNWSRLFGATKSCSPQKPVSRGEAAVCMWVIGGVNAAGTETK